MERKNHFRHEPTPKGSTDNFFPDTGQGWVLVLYKGPGIQDTSVRNCNPPEEDKVGAVAFV